MQDNARWRKVIAGFLMPLLLSAACTPVRPVEKIGLIAPFEGLYRESGYAALNALRKAIEDCAPADSSVIPLAQDDSAQPEIAARTARKLLLDPSVMAIIGPFALDTIDAAAPQLAVSQTPWVAPIAIDASGSFARPDLYSRWLIGYIEVVEGAATDMGVQRLLVTGFPPTWEAVPGVSDSKLTSSTTAFIAQDQLDVDALDATDSVLWLGQPHLGAKVAAQIHEVQPGTAFWMGPQGGDGVFADHYTGEGPVYWISFAKSQYNSESLPDESGSAPAHLTYLAACHVLMDHSGTADSVSLPGSMNVVRLENGIFEPIMEYTLPK